MPRGEPTTPVSFRVDDQLLERVNADAERQNKNPKDWWTDLATAVLDGRLVPAPIKRTPSTREIHPYPKAGKKT